MTLNASTNTRTLVAHPLPRAMLFDLDGTLVDTEPAWGEVVTAAAHRLGLSLSDTDLLFIRGVAAGTVATLFTERSATLTDADALAKALTDDFVKAVGPVPHVMPGALQLLDFVRHCGMLTGLVTASPRRIADLALDGLGAALFDVSVAVGETAETKPHPDPYLAAAAALGVEPRECLAVEDSPVGVASAVAAGMPVVHLTHSLPLPGTSAPRRAGAGCTSISRLADLTLQTISAAYAVTR